jgi:hypothetical protein
MNKAVPRLIAPSKKNQIATNILAFYDRHALTPAGKIPCCKLGPFARAEDDQVELLDIASFACDHR